MLVECRRMRGLDNHNLASPYGKAGPSEDYPLVLKTLGEHQMGPGRVVWNQSQTATIWCWSSEEIPNCTTDDQTAITLN